MEDGGRDNGMRFKAYVRVRPVPGEQPNGVVQPEHRVMYLKDASKGITSEFVFDRVGPTQKQRATALVLCSSTMFDRMLLLGREAV